MPTPARTPLSTVSLADQAYEVLHDRISTGVYPPGSVLRELDLVAQLGVSRTPVREALLRLGEYGLVSLTGRSARVRQVTPDEVAHVYHLRMVLELGAVRAACGRLTAADFALLDALAPADPARVDQPTNDRFGRQLHLLIAERSGNPLLFREIRRFHALIRLAHQHLIHDRGWLAREAREHLAILAALKAGDRGGCVRALRRHLKSACRTNAELARAAAGRPAATGT